MQEKKESPDEEESDYEKLKRMKKAFKDELIKKTQKISSPKTETFLEEKKNFSFCFFLKL